MVADDIHQESADVNEAGLAHLFYSAHFNVELSPITKYAQEVDFKPKVFGRRQKVSTC